MAERSAMGHRNRNDLDRGHDRLPLRMGISGKPAWEAVARDFSTELLQALLSRLSFFFGPENMFAPGE